MSITMIVMIAIGLSMDAFAVSVCKGLAIQKIRLRDALICGVWFGGFQALMPAIGYALGTRFQHMIEDFDHWIAFCLLVIIGASMVRESREEEVSECDAGVSPSAMFWPAVATSIDALAVGVTLAFLESGNFLLSIFLIGCITFLLSVLGVKIGSVFGTKYRGSAQIAGGVMLILLGTKILLEHLDILPQMF